MRPRVVGTASDGLGGPVVDRLGLCRERQAAHPARSGVAQAHALLDRFGIHSLTVRVDASHRRRFKKRHTPPEADDLRAK
jgi:hypothetical protein